MIGLIRQRILKIGGKLESLINIFECIVLVAIGFALGLIVGLGVKFRRADNMPGMKDVQNALWSEKGRNENKAAN